MERGERATRLLAELRRRREEGETGSLEDLVREHPDLEADLRAGADAMALLDLVGRHAEGPASPPAVSGSRRGA